MSDLSITDTNSDYYYFMPRPLPSLSADRHAVAAPHTPPHHMRRSLDHSKTPPPGPPNPHKRTHRRSISLGPLPPPSHPLSLVSGRSSVSSAGAGAGGSHYEASESGSSVFSRRPSDQSLPPTPPSLLVPTRLLFWLVLRVLPNKVEIYLHHRSVLSATRFIRYM